MTQVYLAALANHLWQSTLFAGVAGLVILTLRKNRARVRHWVWLAASCKFLIPLSILIALGAHIPWRQTPEITPSDLSVVMDEVSQPFTAPAVPVPLLPPLPPAQSPFEAVLLVVWICGFVGIGCSWWIRWRRILTTVHTGSLVFLGISIKALSSTSFLEPSVFGLFRPVLLLPEGIFHRLTPAQLEAVIAHELCHVRHRDNLIAAIHMFIETVFWFHPLVWWIGKRMMAERERACDEEVLRQGSEPRVYAEGILNVCKLYVEAPLICVSGITGADLKRRIAEIMTQGIGVDLSLPRRLILAVTALAAIMVPVVTGLLRGQNASVSEFDVVSVKPYAPPGAISEACNSHSDPAMLTLVGCTLKDLVHLAYDLKNYQLQPKGPSWIETDRFVIQAHSSAPATQHELLRMLQPVLATRFRLSIHWADRQAPVYLLQTARQGPKLEPASKTNQCGAVNLRPTTFKSDCLTLDDFAEALQEFIVKDHPVLNRTGVNKDHQYQFNLEYSLNDDPTAGPSIFSALPDQLGLTLKTGKAPVRMLLIDHAERPRPN
jgi:bla regulator protein BlaR1